MNRPGKKGFRSPAYKAQQKAEKKAAEEQDPSATPSRPVTKKRSRTKTEDNSENELAAEPVTKKKRARVKKENNVEIDACDVAEATPQKSRSQTKKRTTNKVNHETDGAEEPEKVRVSAKIKDEETPGNTPNPDISVLRKAKLQVKKPPTKVKEGVLENEDQTTEVGIVGEAILHGKSTSGKKKSASKVQAELVGQEGITNDIHGRNGANRAVKAKSGRKKKNVGIEGPAESFETSKETVRVLGICF
ncbi:hypothetical protein MMC34_004138 [Xylographa carneopallida]|nr:hypothetical protein [Xylographa carneopallida]